MGLPSLTDTARTAITTYLTSQASLSGAVTSLGDCIRYCAQSTGRSPAYLLFIRLRMLNIVLRHFGMSIVQSSGAYEAQQVGSTAASRIPGRSSPVSYWEIAQWAWGTQPLNEKTWSSWRKAYKRMAAVHIVYPLGSSAYHTLRPDLRNFVKLLHIVLENPLFLPTDGHQMNSDQLALSVMTLNHIKAILGLFNDQGG